MHSRFQKVVRKITENCHETNITSTLNCAPLADCTINCIGSDFDVCNGITIECPYASFDCIVYCVSTGHQVCDQSNITAQYMNGGNLFISTNKTNYTNSETSLRNTHIICPVNGGCTILCYSVLSHTICQSLKIEGQYSNYVYFDSQYGIGDGDDPSEVKCPYDTNTTNEEENCTIKFNGNHDYNINIYSLYGFTSLFVKFSIRYESFDNLKESATTVQ